MRHVAAIVLAGSIGLSLASREAHAQTRDEVARHYAPTIYQEAGPDRPRHDFITAFDYDCDWNGDDNREDIESHTLPALVYYAATETDTHWFVHYLPYHPTDDKVTNGHEHDTESILLVIRKTSVPFGVLEVMETRFHTVWYQYARASAGVGDGGDNIDGPIHFDTDGVRPAVYQQAIGHGICGGFAPPCLFTNDYCDLAITCNHDDTPHLNRRGVIYRYDGTSAEPPAPGASDMFTAGYDLVNIESTLWAHRTEIGPGRVYATAIDYDGSRCASDAGLSCPRGFGGNFEGDEGSPPGAMWAQSGGNPSLPDGEVFFDPAYAMSRRLSIPAPLSLTYVFDPYVGIGSLEPARSGTVCDAPVDAGADAAVDAATEAGDGSPDAADRDANDATTSDATTRDAVEADASIDDDATRDVANDAAVPDVVTRDARADVSDGATHDAGSGGRNGGCNCRVVGGATAPRGFPRGAMLAMVGLALVRRRPRRARA
jgi:MYXO-CTERM domain-containing protein